MRTHLARASNVIGWALVVALSSGCATGGALRRTAIASEQLAAATERVQLLIVDLHDRQQLPDGEFRAWQRGIGRLADLGLAINAALREGQGDAMEAHVRAAVALVEELLERDVVRLPADARLAATVALEAIRGVLITLSVGAER